MPNPVLRTYMATWSLLARVYTSRETRDYIQKPGGTWAWRSWVSMRLTPSPSRCPPTNRASPSSSRCTFEDQVRPHPEEAAHLGGARHLVLAVGVAHDVVAEDVRLALAVVGECVGVQYPFQRTLTSLILPCRTFMCSTNSS